MAPVPAQPLFVPRDAVWPLAHSPEVRAGLSSGMSGLQAVVNGAAPLPWAANPLVVAGAANFFRDAADGSVILRRDVDADLLFRSPRQRPVLL